MKVILYPRVSSKKQAKEGDSIDAQKNRLLKYCDDKGYDIVGIYTDAGNSASISDDKIDIKIEGDIFIVKTKLNKRPAFRRILKEAKEKKFDAVVFYKWDRFSRDSSFSKHFKNYFNKLGIKLIPTDDRDDPFISDIRQAMGEEEIRKMKERVRSTRLLKFEQCLMVGRAPYGYRLNKVKKIMEIDKKKAEIVKKIFELKSLGKENNDIAEEVGLQPPSVINILKNKVYYGIISFEGNEKSGVHEPIISKELYDLANP